MGQSRLGAVAEIRSTTTAKDLHMFCLSFCLQGVQLLFSQILQYILKLRKELQLGQVRKHPCVISLLRDIPGCPVRSVTYVTRHKDSWSWIGPSKRSYSASVDLAPRIRPFHPEITQTVPELRDYEQVSPFTSCSRRQMGQEGILDAWR